MVVEHLKRAWAAYKKNFWPLVGAYLLIAAVAGLLVGGGMILVMSPFMVSDAVPTMAQIEASSSNMAIGALISLIGLIISIVLGGAYIAMAAEAINRKTKLRTLVDTIRKRWVSIIGTEILRSIIILLMFLPAVLSLGYAILADSLLVLIVAILLGAVAAFASLLFMFNIYAVVLDKASAVNGIKKSFVIVSKTYFSVLALVVLLTFISLVVSIVPILGSIIAIIFLGPFMVLSFTSFYLSKRKKR